MDVFQVAHRGEWDVKNAIDIVVPLLHLSAQHPNHFEADAVDAHALA